jgi:hypothetical protein
MRGKDFGLLILTVELNPGSQSEQGRIKTFKICGRDNPASKTARTSLEFSSMPGFPRRTHNFGASRRKGRRGDR